MTLIQSKAFFESNNSNAVSQDFMHNGKIFNEVGRMKSDRLNAGFDVLRSQCAPKKDERVFAGTEVGRDDADINVAPLMGFTFYLRAENEGALNEKSLLAQMIQIVLDRFAHGSSQSRLLSRARRFSVCLSHVLA